MREGYQKRKKLLGIILTLSQIKMETAKQPLTEIKTIIANLAHVHFTKVFKIRHDA